ncbi:MAG TPA: hypothetical protein VLL52_25885 [Anaerolineae bacterium]|nr:hypothetical protein [Anaerolineae bacterium]
MKSATTTYPPPILDTHFDSDLANTLARLETYNKHHYRPNSYLHKWWARRCGTTFRLILKHLVPDPDLRDFYTPGGLDGRIILDPMLGGATTLHEAIRLGAHVIGADIDPIPVLQAQATLSPIPLKTLENAFQNLWQTLTSTLGHLWQTTCPLCPNPQPIPQRFTLYAWRRTCDCGPTLSVDTLTLRHETDGTRWQLCPHCGHINYNQNCPCTPASSPMITVRTTTHCPHNHPYHDDTHTPFYQRYQPIAIAGQCSHHGWFFTPPRPHDHTHITQANQQRSHLSFMRHHPHRFAITPGPKSSTLGHHGLTTYLDLFTSRQLLYLNTATQFLTTLPPLTQQNLALLISTSLEFNSLLCGYKGGAKSRPGAIRHVFSYHGYAFPHTAVENNPLYPRQVSGSLRKLYTTRLRRARQWAQAPQERRPNGHNRTKPVPIPGEQDSGLPLPLDAPWPDQPSFKLYQGSATNLPLPTNSVDYIVTDPPYFDSVQYSDLAEFFRVWLRHWLPDAADWEYNQQASAVTPTIDTLGHYQTLLTAIFQEGARLLRPHGRLIFTYHHWNPKSWAALTHALHQADFILINHYVVHAENPISVHINNMKALTHDAILILAPRQHHPSPTWHAPAQINTSNSHQFCSDCTTLLGAYLAQPTLPPNLAERWQQAIPHGPRPGPAN